MRLSLLLGCAILSLTLLGTACGDDSGAESNGPGGTDEAYLAAVCSGSQAFSDALLSKTSADGIADVIRDFVDTMKQADPPADLRKYNEEFVKYLEDAVNDPTSLVTRKPPLPDEEVQRRLAAKEPSVEECKEPTFFSRTAAN